MGIKSHVDPLGLRLLPAVFACALWAGPAPAADVPLLVVGRTAGAQTLTLEGHLEPQRQATVSAQLGGNVLALLVKAGDRVKAGQPLARIDDRDAQAGLQRGDAGLAQAEAEARNARVNAERTRDLRAQGFVSQAALDTAETQLKATQAGVQQAQAARSQAVLARGFASATAPFDGVVLATHLEAGDLASPGRPIVTLFAPGGLRATVQVPLSQTGPVRRASRVEIELPGGQRVQAARQTELASADPVSQTVEWRFDLPAAALPGLVPGQVTRVIFSAAAGAAPPAAATTLQLPVTAVLRRGELTGVYVAQGGRFVLRAVRLGAEHAEGIEILAGLKSGESVAANAVAAGMADARPAP